MEITPDNTEFIVLSFEGPDDYSMVGGLGDRITSLTNTLAETGFVVHHIFIGDPRMEGIEFRMDGKLVLHRWCQWISEGHPGGVYDGEELKFADFTKSAPLFVVQELVKSAMSQGKLAVILAEEWQTAEAMCCIHDLLHIYGWRDKTIMFWNINDTYGFERIDWKYLSRVATIMTVSEYMKKTMLKMGIDSMVIPNGIPEALLDDVNKNDVSQIIEALDTGTIFVKVAKWRQDNGWKPILQAIHNLNILGEGAKLLAQPGIASDKQKITRLARLLNLRMKDIYLEGDPREHYLRAVFQNDFTPYFEAISKGSAAEILNLLFPLPYSFLRVLYRASDVVLANSGYDPFGLVGMEAMAAGAVIFTGCGAEGYAKHMNNSVILDNYTAEDIQFYVEHLRIYPEKRKTISTLARQAAQQWTWPEIVKILISKLEFQSIVQERGLPAETVNRHSEGEA